MEPKNTVGTYFELKRRKYMSNTSKFLKKIIVVVDQRVQNPYEFSYPTTAGSSLPFGDYSLLGFVSKVAIVRKTIEDLRACVKPENSFDFEQELHQTRSLDYFALIIEGTMSDLAQAEYRYPGEMSTINVFQSVLDLSVRYRVPVWVAETRQMGQRIVERLLMEYVRHICIGFDVMDSLRRAVDLKKALTSHS